MSNAQHTPGPWGVEKVKPSTVNGNDDYYAVTHGTDGELVSDGVYGLANARLIAAAPETAAERDRLKEINAELLGALEALSHMYGQAWDRTDGALVMLGKSINDFELAHKNAEAAIAKAKGEAQ